MPKPLKPLTFEWRPGEGPDREALAQLHATYAVRPHEPMGEAWFMSDSRRMYDDLLHLDVATGPLDTVQTSLGEIASGTAAFGSMDEWHDWFHYFLPRLIPRSHEGLMDQVLELVTTALVTQYPAGLDDGPYPEFRADVLNTLGRCLMDTLRWPNGQIDLHRCLDKELNATGLWYWFDADGPFSASMFLCLKYLHAEEIDLWLRSVFGIDEPHWRAQVACWLHGAHRVLSGEAGQPADFPDQIAWGWSHCLKGDYTGDLSGKHRVPFLPEPNCAAALATIRQYFSKELVLSWIGSFAVDPALDRELGDIPLEFIERYELK